MRRKSRENENEWKVGKEEQQKEPEKGDVDDDRSERRMMVRMKSIEWLDEMTDQ